MLGGTIMMFAGLLASIFFGTKLSALFVKQVGLTFSFAFSPLMFQQSCLILVTMIVTASSIRNLQAKSGLPLLNRIVGWAVLGTLLYLHTAVKTTDLQPVVSTALPFVYRCEYDKFSKIITYFLGFSPLFIILSISVEGLFFISYTLTLLLWVEVERLVRAEREADKKNRILKKDVEHPKAPLSRSLTYDFQADDLRIALFFLFFVQVGFFGTGK